MIRAEATTQFPNNMGELMTHLSEGQNELNTIET